MLALVPWCVAAARRGAAGSPGDAGFCLSWPASLAGAGMSTWMVPPARGPRALWGEIFWLATDTPSSVLKPLAGGGWGPRRGDHRPFAATVAACASGYRLVVAVRCALAAYREWMSPQCCRAAIVLWHLCSLRGTAGCVAISGIILGTALIGCHPNVGLLITRFKRVLKHSRASSAFLATFRYVVVLFWGRLGRLSWKR